MASVKLVLRKNKQRKDGKVPIAIRITKDRKSSYLFTGQYILETQWNPGTMTVKKSHPNSTRLNFLLSKLLAEANEKLIEGEVSKSGLVAGAIKKQVRIRKGGSFYQLAEERIRLKMDQGVFSVANAERSILNNIRRFHQSKDLQCDDITVSFLQRFKSFCKTELEQKSSRTITNQLIFIRTVYNMAIKQGIAKREHYPFGGENEKIRIKRSMKIGLISDEISAIENLDLPKSTSIDHARNVFLFSFYLAGIRISDVLKIRWDDIKDGRLYYVMNKNEKPVSLKIPDQAQSIIEKYNSEKEQSRGFIFPFLNQADLRDSRDVFKKTRNATSLFNKHLKRIADMASIKKNLSNHIARHSFGNIAGDRINPLMLQKLYRHSDLKTTINYQANFIHRDADDALDMVINS